MVIAIWPISNNICQHLNTIIKLNCVNDMSSCVVYFLVYILYHIEAQICIQQNKLFFYNYSNIKHSLSIYFLQVNAEIK
jgi:hypothetical protein